MRLLLTLLVFALTTQKPTRQIFDTLGELPTNQWMVSMNSIILLGTTGVGKSTLVNLIAGCKLVPKQSSFSKDLVYAIDEKVGCQPSKIGHGIASETSLPIFVPSLLDKDVALFDTAGFSETRGYMYDVVNHYGI